MSEDYVADSEGYGMRPVVGRCFDQCPPMFGITGPVCILPYGHLGSHESEHGTIWSFMPGVDAPTPTASGLESGAEPPTQVGDRRPAAEAGRADEALDVSRLLLRAVRDFGTGFVWRHPSTGKDHVLNPADVTVVIPAGQLTDIERLTAQLAEVTRERDEALGVLAKFADDEPCHFDHHGNCQAHRLDPPPCSVAEAKRLTETERGRD